MSLKTIVLVVCLVSPAVAAPTKYARSQDVRIDAKVSARAKPKPHDDAKPAITATQALEVEGLVGGYRGQQEGLLVDLIRDTPDGDAEEKAKLYFMLGELYAKQQRYWRLRSIEHESASEAEQAKKFLVKAVKTYDALASNPAFRNFAQMDVALFYYGYTLQSGHYVDEARKVFDKLLSDYPASKYVPEAHFAFAEYYFDKNDLANAESRYRKVLQFPKSSAYWYAMYKLGWIYLNEQKPQQALEVFFQVSHGAPQDLLVRSSRKDFVRAYAEIGKADKALEAFKRVDAKAAQTMVEILADLYLEQGKSDKAIFVYRELMAIAPGHKNVCAWQNNVVGATMSLPGAQTADKVKEVENLVHLYKGLHTLPRAEEQECHDNAAAVSGELARAYHSEAARTKNPDTLAFAERLYRVYLDTFAEAPDHAQLEYFYAELLWSRADAETNARTKTALWEAAAEAFTRVVKNGKVDAKTLQISAYAPVLAWKNALDIDPRPSKQVGNLDEEASYERVPAELPIPPREQKLIAAFELYIRYIKDPKDSDLVDIKFHEANTYRRYNHFAQAVPLFVDILAHHRQHEAAESAAQLLLDTYNRIQRYDDMLALVDRLYADPEFLKGKDALVDVLHRVKRQALRKGAVKTEKAAAASKDLRKYVACGEAYLAIYNLDTLAADNDEILYDALVCYQEGKSIGVAALVYGKLKQYYPKSKLYARATARIGRAYGDIAFYDKAAEKLEEYAKQFANEQDAFLALGEAVFYSKGIGDDAKAIENTKYFIRVFGAKRPQEAANAMFALTSVYEKQGNPDALIAHLRAYLRDYGDKFGADRRVIAYTKIGQALWHQSCPAQEVDGSCIKVVRERALRVKTQRLPTQCGPLSKSKLTVIARDPGKVKAALTALAAAKLEATGKGGTTDEARHFYAQAKLIEADRDYEAYLALPFPVNLDFAGAARKTSLQRFDGWLAERTKIGGRAKAEYDAVLAIKDNASSIAAAARIAQISQNLSDALFTAEIPTSVRTGPYAADKIEAFCDKLTEIADPLDVTALTAYGECLAQSTRLGWFSEWSRLCERELGQIDADKFPSALELRPSPNQLAAIVASEPPVEL
ncbi:MAG: Tetratricopeptide repeat protein [Myxococcales bacterium]|nr:Tetratricopeptide repeat protein [Myxococcales bacterium]